jgi:hypothetical protein
MVRDVGLSVVCRRAKLLGRSRSDYTYCNSRVLQHLEPQAQKYDHRADGHGSRRESKSAGREQGQEAIGRLTAGATYWYFDKRLIEEEDSLLELESGGLAGGGHALPAP